MERIICLVIGYMFELFQIGYLYGKYEGIDICQHGGGNSGSTSAPRVTRTRVGFIVSLGDFFKTVISCFLVRILLGDQPDYLYVWILHAGFGVILGHNFPLYLNFKGGKEIAATVEIVTSLDWRLVLLCLVAFVLVVTVIRYISLGSFIVSTILVVWSVVMGQMGAYGPSIAARPEFYGISAVITTVAFRRRGANIVKLVQGKKSKVGAKRK